MVKFSVDNFWRRVEMLGDDDCWEWQASVDTRGYGHLGMNGKIVRAHRLAYALANGVHLPAKGDASFVVMHSCDNRKCCNPAHLSAGAQLDNVRDCETKRRGNHPAGAKNGRAVLTADDAAAIRSAAEGKMKLSRKYGVSPAQIQRIRAGKQWAAA